MSNFFDRNNIIHNATLLFIGFAGVTDGKLSKREINQIKKIVIKLLNRFDLDINNDGEINEEDFNQLFTTIEKHFKHFYFGKSKSFLERIGISSKSDDSYPIEFVREISYAITQIKLHSKFTKNLGKEIINGLNEVAHSDTILEKEEERWINIIEDEFNS
tara:strand:+ start:37 stop:516 length:480 start_codon:yes stop_codon:yes gene_type:complete